MTDKRTKKEIQEELDYTRGRYRDALREGREEDAKILEKDIEELEEELEGCR